MKRSISPLVLFLFFAASLSASTVLKVGLDRLSRSAGRVVSGEVLSVNPVAGENGVIFSDVTLRVARAMPRALTGRTITLRMIGGEMDGRRVYLQGMPRFEVGDEVVLFLNRRTAGVMGATVGLWQGVFYLGRDKGTGQEYVLDHTRRPLMGLTSSNELMRGAKLPEGVSLRSLSIDGGNEPLTADGFFERVRRFRGSLTE